MLSTTTTVAKQELVLPEASVTNTSTMFSPKLEQSKLKLAGSADPHTPENV